MAKKNPKKRPKRQTTLYTVTQHENKIKQNEPN